MFNLLKDIQSYRNNDRSKNKPVSSLENGKSSPSKSFSTLPNALNLQEDAISKKGHFDKSFDIKSMIQNQPRHDVDCSFRVDCEDILVFIDDEHFFKKEDAARSIIPPTPIKFIQNSTGLTAQPPITTTVEQNLGRIKDLQLALDNKIGIDEMKSVCEFLRRKKLALLEDNVYLHVEKILGDETDSVLLSIFELLMLEKRLGQVS